jgi:hypothetical protein
MLAPLQKKDKEFLEEMDLASEVRYLKGQFNQTCNRNF